MLLGTGGGQNIGTGGSLTSYGDDHFGVITLVTGAGCDANIEIDAVFAVEYGLIAGGPRVEVKGADAISDAKLNTVALSDRTTFFFTLTGLSASNTYKFMYFVQ
jgi:hypothetical protein